jgi:AraC-like DNA-binding protein
MKSDFKYQPNLAIREFTIPSGGEWLPRANGWLLIHVRQGSGYCLQPQGNRELLAGSLLLVAGFLQGSIRASQLGDLSLGSFHIIPERLTGLITLDEQHLLKLPPADESLLKILPPESPVSLKASGMFAGKNRRGLLFRLKLLQIFAKFLLEEPRQPELMEFTADTSDAMKRLQAFLQDLPVSELLELDFNELAERTRCTSRHLSRIFFRLVGMSFTDKRAELRLKKAQDILATTNSKVVQVALESGYNSLSQFNLMFARRYGISPGKWRRENRFANIKGNGINGGNRIGSAESQPVAVRGNLSLKQAGSRGGTGKLRLKKSEFY